MSCEKLVLLYANSKGGNQTAHVHSLKSTFVIRGLARIIAWHIKSKSSKCLIVYGDKEVGATLTRWEILKTGFLAIIHLISRHVPLQRRCHNREIEGTFCKTNFVTFLASEKQYSLI